MKPIKYQKAIDSSGNIIDIQEVDDSRRDETFTCVGCGQRIYPRLGKSRTHHFYHKEGECNSETYLHNLAKNQIYKWFYSGTPFVLNMPATVICSCKDECKFYDKEACKQDIFSGRIDSNAYDLHKYYDECLVEEKVGNFVGDIVLRDSKTQRVLLIEIVVTHPCDPVKWNSGYRIIETNPISNESQISDLVKDGFTSSNCRLSDAFKPQTITKKLVSNHMSRFMYFGKSGKAQIPSPYPTGDYEYDTQFSIDCDHLHVKKHKFSTKELNVIGDYLGEPSSYQLGFLYMHIHYDVKHCAICKYYDVGDRFCPLSKKYSTPAFPEGPEARECPYFRVMNYQKEEVEAKVFEV